MDSMLHALLVVNFFNLFSYVIKKKMTIMSSLFSSFWCKKDDDNTCCCLHPFLVWSYRSTEKDDEQRVTHVAHITHCHFFFYYALLLSSSSFCYEEDNNDIMCCHRPVMPVCMASYMTAGYRHANHAF